MGATDNLLELLARGMAQLGADKSLSDMDAIRNLAQATAASMGANKPSK